MRRRPNDLSNPIYLDGESPYYEVNWDNWGLIVVSRTDKAAMNARGMGEMIGRNQITERVDGHITQIDDTSYVYNSHTIDIDLEHSDFVLTYKQKHYMSRFGISSILTGVYDLEVKVMNNSQYIEDYFDLLTKKENRIRSEKDRNDERENNAKIKAFLVQYLNLEESKA
ncbi:hypothetical protein [Vibrio agarivorans]|uniref:hypothetical protein n=1 Tax=Vibrio agarivorans TaxID=153622 RepID=UPI0025B58EE2|nr:hypothetical protein [Vibrio agarivorans]MDN3661041.1 hypothetical protein [Vibrio agarivorans]